jgi:hypothetical protein
VSVQLVTQGNNNYPGGITTEHADVDGAKAQAIADLQSGHEPPPDRIVDGGSIVFDRNQLLELAFPDND